MFRFSLLCIVLAVANGHLTSSRFETETQFQTSLKSFNNHVAKHGLTFSSPAEKVHRFHAFAETDERIKQHNQNSSFTWTKGHNQFSHFYPYELTHLRGLRRETRPVHTVHYMINWSGSCQNWTGLVNNGSWVGVCFNWTGVHQTDDSNTCDAQNCSDTPLTSCKSLQGLCSNWTEFTNTTSLFSGTCQNFVGVCYNSTDDLVTSKPEVYTYNRSELGDLPTAVDWRANGFVTPVKDQGQCGSCWAFSSTGAMEGAHACATGKLVSLSEEDLVDCVSTCYGCGGGWMTTAMQWVVDHGGIDTEESYPYNPDNAGSCQFNKSNVGATFSKVVALPTADCDALLHAVATVGPISVAVDANDIMNYQTGIFTDPGCDKQALDHGVLVVGYGQTTDGHKFWIVKNSWNANWGQDGYIYWDRDADDVCGICQVASYPVV